MIWVMRFCSRTYQRCLQLAALLALWACTESEQSSTAFEGLADYPISPVNIQKVRVTDDFWLPIIERVQEKTIDFALEKCAEEGRFENFLIAAGDLSGEARGEMPFDDTDVYKTIEGISNSLISSPNEQLEVLLDSLIAIIARGQEPDGYLTTWRTIDPAAPPAKWVKVIEGKRWESLESSHELYNAGHLYEAAAVHYLATGKKNFLDVATRNADLMVETFGPGKIETVPGHQIIETGLIKLYRITGNKSYLELARYFLEGRGRQVGGRELFGSYSQDHLPVTEQEEVVGHAVRAVYMYTGMTDIAAIYQDTAYADAIDRLWDNMVTKKMYVTGGIGASRHGESFGAEYELPNMTAYSETCAAIGSVYWNHRLFQLKGDVKYIDVLERTLYNGLISGLSLDGQKFFYPNALESDGKYEFNMGQCTRQSWFDCSCCPTNLIRFIPSIPGLIYARDDDNLFVNLYMANEAEVDMAGKSVQITQQTNYPWDGHVTLTITAKEPTEFSLKLRIPGWARGEVLPSDLYRYRNDLTETPQLNGEPLNMDVIEGYVTINQTWEGTETIVLDFPMAVREVLAHERVEEDQGKLSLEYGPLVYAIEEVDNPGVFDDIAVGAAMEYSVSDKPQLLEGVEVISGSLDGESFTAIPYYAWSNRGVGKMKVWIPQKGT